VVVVRSDELDRSNFDMCTHGENSGMHSPYNTKIPFKMKKVKGLGWRLEGVISSMILFWESQRK